MSRANLMPLVSFNGADSADPLAPLIADANGNLFRTTAEGGANNAGTVFEVTDSGFFVFAGTPGKPNCHGRSVWALAQQYGRPRPGERRQTGTAASMPQLPRSATPPCRCCRTRSQSIARDRNGGRYALTR